MLLTDNQINQINQGTMPQELIPMEIPVDLLRVVYLYDPTYREIYDIVIDELELNIKQQDQKEDFEVDQQIERDMFDLYSHLYIADILGYSSDSSVE
jgi:hypothetical protein